MLSKQSALTLLPRFAGQSLGSTIFLWAKSILPPTGIVDFAAAGIAVSITFAMLASVNYLLSNNLDILNKGTELMDKFNQYKAIDISGILKALKENQSIRDIVSKMIS
jgi:hypothetical protein